MKGLVKPEKIDRDKSIGKLVKKCSQCKENEGIERALSPMYGLGALPSNSTCVLFSSPDYFTKKNTLGPQESEIVRMVHEETGIHLRRLFHWYPIVRCFVEKIKPKMVSNCRCYIPKYDNYILFGKESVRWFMYGGVAPPDMWMANGRILKQGELTVMPLCGPEILDFETYDADRILDHCSKFRKSIRDKSDSLLSLV